MKNSGWINVDKPYGMSSAKVVSILRWLFNTRKVGHAGTLDPLATGVLPVAIGEATKTIFLIQDRPKEYQFTLQFGKEMTTYDEEGEVVAESDFMPSLKQLKQILPEFSGNIMQVPPVFSAIRIEGRRAYDIARSGESIEMKPRQITIHSLVITDFDPLSKSVSFRVECGKGTYIRSLGHDLAKKLGGLGYIKSLRRTKVGHFTKKNLISIEKLKELVHNTEPEDCLLSVDSALDDIPAILFSEEDANKLLRGMKIKVADSVASNASDYFFAKSVNQVIAFGKIANSYFVPIRVFNL
jgi:tRNA pseudouridine55 synthase